MRESLNMLRYRKLVGDTGSKLERLSVAVGALKKYPGGAGAPIGVQQSL